MDLLGNAWLRLVRARIIGDDDAVFAILVLEEVEDPFILHQPRQEVERAFAVLHDILPWRIRSLAGERVIGDAELLQDFLGDLDHRHVLIDPVVESTRQQPELGDYFHHVDDVAHLPPLLRQSCNDSITKLRGSVLAVDGNGDALADKLREVNSDIVGAY